MVQDNLAITSVYLYMLVCIGWVARIVWHMVIFWVSLPWFNSQVIDHFFRVIYYYILMLVDRLVARRKFKIFPSA